MNNLRSVSVIHEDENCIRRRIVVENCPHHATDEQVEGAVNCIVFPLPFPASMDFSDIASNVRETQPPSKEPQ